MVSTEGWSKEKIDGFWTNFGQLSDDDEPTSSGGILWLPRTRVLSKLL